MFNEGQFEAYRRLGEKMAREATSEFFMNAKPTSAAFFVKVLSALRDWHLAESDRNAEEAI